MTEQQQDTQRQQQSPLHTEGGTTTIQDGVVAKVVGIAAQEVEGVRMGGSASQTADDLLGSITGGGTGGSLSRGVSVEVGEVEAAADLTMTVEYGRSVPKISEAVRKNVSKRVENLLGLQVTEVNITVGDVFFPQEEQQQDQEQQG